MVRLMVGSLIQVGGEAPAGRVAEALQAGNLVPSARLPPPRGYAQKSGILTFPADPVLDRPPGID